MVSEIFTEIAADTLILSNGFHLSSILYKVGRVFVLYIGCILSGLTDNQS